MVSVAHPAKLHVPCHHTRTQTPISTIIQKRYNEKCLYARQKRARRPSVQMRVMQRHSEQCVPTRRHAYRAYAHAHAHIAFQQLVTRSSKHLLSRFGELMSFGKASKGLLPALQPLPKALSRLMAVLLVRYLRCVRRILIVWRQSSRPMRRAVYRTCSQSSCFNNAAYEY
jgi:hypothetical protein